MVKKTNKHSFLIFFITSISLIFCNLVFSQDIHYSQFNASPQNLNPGLNGLFNGDIRFIGNYRTQWAGISTPIITNSIATDIKFNTQFKGFTPAFGVQFNYDKTGDSNFTTTQLFITTSTIKKITKDSTHLLSIGVQPGLTKKSYNQNALTYDKQYDGDNFNPSLSSGENDRNGTSISYLDIGGGINYLWKKSTRKQLTVGASIFHINQPKQSFFGNQSNNLNSKIIINGLIEYPINEKIDILPTFLFQKQGIYTEMTIGAMGKYYLKPSSGMTTAISFGIMYRHKDASILAGMIEFRNITTGISYDINQSKLMAASNNRGGFEISFIYIYEKPRALIFKKRSCPVYM